MISIFFFFVSFCVALNDACYENPDQDICKGVTIDPEEATKNVTKLCNMRMLSMYMPGCSIRNICEGNNTDKKIKDSAYCKPVSELKSICHPMASHGMSLCWKYDRLCPEKTKVEQCKTEVVPLPEDTVKLVKSICSSMWMEGCEKCIDDDGKPKWCDFLAVYSELCIVMPEMPECGAQRRMCKAIPEWPLCAEESVITPRMQMYFHLGMYDYILFKSWVPTSVGMYVLSIFAVFMLAVLEQGFRLLKEVIVIKLDDIEKKKGEHILINTDFNNEQAPASYNFFFEIIKAFLAMLELLFHYFLMLIAMTFNVGLFVAIMIGNFFGNFIFSTLRKMLNIENKSTTVVHHH